MELDLKITILSVQTWFILDPCNFTFSVGLDKLSFNSTLFKYSWGKAHQIRISESLNAM